MSANTLRKSNYDVDGFINQLLASKKFDKLAEKVADKAVDKIRHINDQPIQRSNIINVSVVDQDQAKDRSLYPNEHEFRSQHQHEYKEESSKENDKDISVNQDKKTSSREYDRESSIHQEKYREAYSKEYDIESSKHQDKYPSSKEYYKLSSILQDRDTSKNYDKETTHKNGAEPDTTFKKIDSKAIMKKKIISDPSDLKLKYKYLTRHAHMRDDKASNSSHDPVLKNKKPEKTYTEPVTENVKEVSLEETHLHDSDVVSEVYNHDILDTEKERKYSDDEKKVIDLEEGDKNIKKLVTAKNENETKINTKLQEENTNTEQVIQPNKHVDVKTKPELITSLTKLVKAKAHNSIENVTLKEDSVAKSNESNEGKKVENNFSDKDAAPMWRARSESDNVEENKVVPTSDDSRKGSEETRIRKPLVRKEGNKLYTFVQAPEYEEYLEEVEKIREKNKGEVDLFATF